MVRGCDLRFDRAIGTTKMTPVEVVTDHAATYPSGLGERLRAAWHRAVRHQLRRVRSREAEGAAEEPANRRVAAAFDELAMAV